MPLDNSTGMKRNRLKKRTRILLLVSSIALIIILFVPMWRIDLSAPQYPEGLKLLIYPDHLGGNVAIINGLNHYIGMKTLHTADFPEFKLLPYIIIFFSLLLLIVALIGSWKLLNIVALLFISFGIIAMIDFWRWEYNYGHNLNPDAAIIIPGMAYQPPLIGYKQLLNFSAFSMPDIGGWVFAGVGLLLLLLIISEWIPFKKRKQSLKPAAIIAVLLFFFTSSCNNGPEIIVTGKDHCDFCKMTVSDPRFGAEIVTKKGKVFKFDDAHCILSFLQKGDFDRSQVKDIYFRDFSGDHSLIKTNKAFFLESEDLKSPMEGNIAAFSNRDSLDKIMTGYKGKVLNWDELWKP